MDELYKTNRNNNRTRSTFDFVNGLLLEFFLNIFTPHRHQNPYSLHPFLYTHHYIKVLQNKPFPENIPIIINTIFIANGKAIIINYESICLSPRYNLAYLLSYINGNDNGKKALSGLSSAIHFRIYSHYCGSFLETKVSSRHQIIVEY
jgi:hypothetical protein